MGCGKDGDLATVGGTWNPGAPCFDWSLDLVLEGSRPKIEDKQVPSSYKIVISCK